MVKIKNFFKKYYPDLLAMLIPVIIFLIASLFGDIFPLGEYSVAKYDGYYQYPGFLSYFRRVLLESESLFFSFKGILGYNFYATAIYYLFNPSNLLSIFFENENLLYFYTIIVYLRIALCGFTMCKFLRYNYKAKNDIFLILFSVCYAIMGYNVCYFYNYMYFDAVVLLPIVMIGVLKIIRENKCLLYIVSLTITIISNFYIGFMVCIFSLLYFIYNYILLEKKDRSKTIIKNFTICSVLCGLMCAVVIIPVAYELFQGKADLYLQENQTEYFKFNMNFINIFYKLTPGSMHSYDVIFGTVNVYISLLSVVFVIKYFFNTKISKKEKIVTISFILFFILSISFNLIDYFWHFMQRPIWYPNRYIFTFSFFLITIAYKSYKYRGSIKMSWFPIVIIILLYITLMIYPAINANFDKRFMQIILFIFSIMILCQYMLFIENKNATMIIVGLFFLEICVNTIFTFKQLSNVTSIDFYKLEVEKYENIVDSFKKDNERDGDLFYRAELNANSNYNSGAMYGYNGVNTFNSIRNGNVMDFFDIYFNYAVGDSASIKNNNFNPYLTSILDVKYINGYIDEDYYELIHDYIVYMYKNPDALSLGFMVNDSVYDYNFRKNESFYNTKSIVDSMTNKDNDVYEYLNDFEFINAEKIYDKKSKMYKIKTIDNDKGEAMLLLKGTALNDGFLVIHNKLRSYTKTRIIINNNDYSSYITNRKMPLFIEKGDEYEIRISSSNIYPFEYTDIYMFNYDTYIEFINESKKNILDIYEYESDDNLKGKVVATKDKNVLFTSIPYNEGWKIYVDGEKKEYRKCYNAFICLNLEEGEHDIEFKFVPKYLILSSSISGLALIATIVYLKKRKN